LFYGKECLVRKAEQFCALGCGCLAAVLFALGCLLLTPAPAVADGPMGCQSRCIFDVWMTQECGRCNYIGYNCEQAVYDSNGNYVGRTSMACAERICSRRCAPPSDPNTAYNCGAAPCAEPTTNQGSICSNDCWGKFCGDLSTGTQCGEQQVNNQQPPDWSTDNVVCGCILM
jgi:hypothetical protein